MDITKVTCAVIVKNGMVLAASRNGEGLANVGKWEFPGGSPKEGESCEACVIRRINETLGLNINIIETLKSFTIEGEDGRTFEMHKFICDVVDGRAILTKHSRAEWFMPIQLMRLAWPQSDIPIIDEIISRVMMNGRII